jgi:DNA-binding Lrp family transcriptional regulator
MVSKGVIQEYIADINFAFLGYRILYIFTKQEEKVSGGGNSNIQDSNKDRRNIIIEHLNSLGDILAEIEVLGGISIFRVAIREAFVYKAITRKDDYNTISLLNTSVIEKAVLASNTRSFQTSAYNSKQPYPTPTDLKIMRCLVLNPKIGVADIARLASVSARTANRILNKLKDDGVLRFSVICNPAAMKGLVVFGLLIYVNDSEGSGIGEQKRRRGRRNLVLIKFWKDFILNFQNILSYVLHLSVMMILLLYLSLVMMSFQSIQCIKKFYHFRK